MNYQKVIQKVKKDVEESGPAGALIYGRLAGLFIALPLLIFFGFGYALLNGSMEVFAIAILGLGFAVLVLGRGLIWFYGRYLSDNS